MYTYNKFVRPSERVLHIQGVIGDILYRHFNALASTKDWEKLYLVLTTRFNKFLMEIGDSHLIADVKPTNTHDLVWKTKLRFLALHKVRHFYADGQKRGVSFSSALMGIRPVKRIADCKVADDKVRFGVDMDPLRSCDKALKGSDSNLMTNQAFHIAITIGLVNSDFGAQNHTFTAPEIKFYKHLSATLAEAASKAETRSWKDFAIGCCESPEIRLSSVPADFDKCFFLLKEDASFAKQVKKASTTDMSGVFIETWRDHLKDTIIRKLFDFHHSRSFAMAMPNAAPLTQIGFFIYELKTLMEKCSGNKFFFPKKVPVPQAVLTLIHLVFLIAPAQSTKKLAAAISEVDNPGLDNLRDVFRSKGEGQLSLQDPLECVEITSQTQKGYIQTVSRIVN
jgi:hypothetical protein